MNRFNLLTYTAAVALAGSACASCTTPRLFGAKSQPLSLASTTNVENAALAGYAGEDQQVNLSHYNHPVPKTRPRNS